MKNEVMPSDFCSDMFYSCSNCEHLKNISNQGVPVYSCDFMFSAGAYNGCYAKHDIFNFCCTHYNPKEINEN